MMKNKELKKSLLLIGLFSIIFLFFLCAINNLGIKMYSINNNKIISTILTNVKEQYPEIKEADIVQILNTKKLKENEDLAKYGIDIHNDEVSIVNKNLIQNMVLINIGVIFLYLFLIFVIIIFYNKNEQKKIKEIANYLSKINNHDYKLDIVSNSEDELSFLKNEIYKTAVTLNEQAILSKEDKKSLKKSLSDISHQLKTPLTSIMIMLDTIMDQKDMDEKTKKEFLTDIYRKINHINFLIQALLKLSRFDANTIKFDNKEVYIKDIIKEAVCNVSMLSELKEINIIIKGENEKIVCDEKWQIEAITNILKNCIEHSNKKDSIIISYGENKIYSSITIKDTGKGIDKKDLPHIFERFYKGRNASSDSIGIGLALAKTIIEANDGSISVKSKLEKGTTFEIKYFKV